MPKENNQLNHSSFETMVTFMPSYLFWKDKHGVYQGCNQQFATLIGLTSSLDIIGKTDLELPWKDRIDIIQKHDEIILNFHKECQFEETLAIQGQNITLLINKKPIFARRRINSYFSNRT